MESLKGEKQIEHILKQIIDREGVNYLSTSSYAVYNELLKTDPADKCLARLILITLLAGAVQRVADDEAALSAYIQKECCLKKSVSDKLAGLYVSLFGTENRREWDHKTDEGFRKFCEKQWHFDLEAHGIWYGGNVHIDADCYASVDIEVDNSSVVRRELEKLLKKNPFTPAETIYSYFDKKLEKELSSDFDEYVSCDDYYPPVAEDYDSNFEDLILEFCKRCGFKLISYECDGETSDFIPD